MLEPLEVELAEERVEIDLARVDWYDDFFDRHAPDGELEVTRARTWSTVVDEAVVPGQATGHPLSESGYWELFLSGYGRYRQTGRVAPSDPYVAYLMGPFRAGDYDHGLSPLLASADATVDRVARRYADMDRLSATDPSAGVPPAIDPVRLLASAGATEDDFTAPVIGRQDRLAIHSFDGYHRVFGARLLGFSSLPCLLRLVSPETSPFRAGVAR